MLSKLDGIVAILVLKELGVEVLSMRPQKEDVIDKTQTEAGNC